jgi:hypothetical protein
VLRTWYDLGVSDTVLGDARALLGRKYAKLPEYRAAVEKAVGADVFNLLWAALQKGNRIPFKGTVSDGPVTGFSARGSLGQYLVVLPKARVVAVRMRDPNGDGYHGSEDGNRGDYPSFADEVGRLF